jgi:Na+/proline symporter
LANFKVHFNTGAIASGILSSTFLSLDMISPAQSGLFLFLGTLGSILPDIDSNNSVPLRVGFQTLAIVFSFLVLFKIGVDYSVVEMLILWGFTFVFIKQVVLRLFNKHTRHRGVFHSIPAGLLFGLLTTVSLYHIFEYHHFHAWLGGFFVFFGYIVHLTLDEIYSVDFTGRKIKKSFGTALKVYDKKSLNANLYLYACIAVAFLFVPSFENFVYVITHPKLYENISVAFLPAGTWFKGIF